MARVNSSCELSQLLLSEVCTQGFKLYAKHIHRGLSGTRVTWHAWKEGADVRTAAPALAFEMSMPDYASQYDVEQEFRRARRGSVVAWRR